MSKLLFAIAAIMTIATTVRAEDWRQVTTCRGMKGTAFYFAGGAVSREKSGWQNDAITGGTTSLLTNGKDVDIVYKDSTGRQRSTKFHDKAHILFFPGATIQKVLVVHQGGSSLEEYTFQLDRLGRGIVILTQQREGVVSKVAMMQATCKGN